MQSKSFEEPECKLRLLDNVDQQLQVLEEWKDYFYQVTLQIYPFKTPKKFREIGSDEYFSFKHSLFEGENPQIIKLWFRYGKYGDLYWGDYEVRLDKKYKQKANKLFEEFMSCKEEKDYLEFIISHPISVQTYDQ